MKKCGVFLLLVLTMVFMTSCAQRYVAPKAAVRAPARPAPAPAVKPEPEKQIGESEKILRAAERAALPAKVPARMETGLLTAPAREEPPKPIPSAEEKQKFNIVYDKADIAEVTNQIFGEFLKLNYVLDPALQGRISLFLEGEYTKAELLQLIVKAYTANNISVVPRKGIYLIQPLQRSATSSLPVADAFILREEKDGVQSPVIVIYRPRYLNANQALNTIRLFLTPGRPINTDPLTNTIIFAEDVENARTIVNILKTMDINVLQEVGMEVVPLKALTPEEAVQGMETLMGKLAMFRDSALQANLAFIPLQKFGGVLVLAQNPEVLKMAKQWLTALDIKGREVGLQIYVYFVQNSLAGDIANILSQVFVGREGAPTARPQERIVSATQPRAVTPFSELFPRQENQQSTPSAFQPPGEGEPGEVPGAAAGLPTEVTRGVALTTRLTGEVAIIPDEVNNAIVVKANATDYALIRRTIEALDILPRAVLIEVMIAEISLQNDLQYGVEWFFREGKAAGALRDSPLNFSNIDLRRASAAGLNFFWGNIGGDINVLLKALAAKTQVNILSTPTLLASDNKEASITVGGREPIPTGAGVTGDVAITSIQYEETGIILTVTPHINVGGLVRLDVDQTIRNFAGSVVVGDGSTAPRFTERKVKTTLIAQDGSTVIIGGIIEQRNEVGKRGIPFVQDVPLISPLFSTRNRNIDRTELIIAITPHVVDHQLNETTREFLQKLQVLRKRIEAGI